MTADYLSWGALNAGIAEGAHIILIPKIPYKLEKVCRKIQKLHAQGKNFSIVIVSEAVGNDQGITFTKIQSFGVAAVDLIAEGKFDRMVAWQRREVISVSIEEAIRNYRAVSLDDALIHTVRGLGICLGD